MASHVLVVGSANVDFTLALERLPEPGETVSEGTLLIARGGKGANQAVAARRLGAEVRLIGCVGDDASGREVRAALADEGIGVAGIASTAQAPTGTALILVDRAGRNQIGVAPGANRALTVAQVHARADDFAWAEVVVASCEIPLECVAAALELARRRGAPTILNPAPVPRAPIDRLDLVDYLTPNAGEAARLSGAAGEEAAADALVARGAGTVIVTLGAAGALARGRAGRHRVPGLKVDAVDTTAAGDAFNGALAVALAERRDLASALRFANAAAALACTKRGAQPSLPMRAEVERLVDG
ncbi:MAG TPA: ribokinase [Methylomirabilota bacterium]|jgi:ribokinase